MKIVLDTNVLVSASLKTTGLPGTILGLAAEEKFEFFVSPFILNELEVVLGSARIGFSPAKIRETVDNIKQIAKMVIPRTKVDVISAKDTDNRILECAIEAKADIIVTGNMKHVRPLSNFQDIAILTPREFLAKYFPDI